MKQKFSEIHKPCTWRKMHWKIKWKLCSNFSFQYFIKFIRLIIESLYRQDNNALCSPRYREVVATTSRVRWDSGQSRLIVWGEKRVRGTWHDRPLNRPVTYDDDDRATRHLARMVPRIQVSSTGCFYLEGVLDFCSVHLLGRRVLVGTWTGSVCIRLRDGGVMAGGNASWDPPIAAALSTQTYVCIIHVYNTRKKRGSWRMIRLSQAPGFRETERESPNYGNSSSVLYHLRCIAWCTMHVRQHSCDEETEKANGSVIRR